MGVIRLALFFPELQIRGIFLDNSKIIFLISQQKHMLRPTIGSQNMFLSGFSLTPYLESFTPIFGLETPVFQRISSNSHSGTPTFTKIYLWDSCFQNPSENPVLWRTMADYP